MKVKMIRFEMDVAYDETFEEMLEEWGQKYPYVFVRMIQLRGPGGGWPVLEIAIPESEAKNWLVAVGWEPDEADDILEDAVAF